MSLIKIVCTWMRHFLCLRHLLRIYPCVREIRLVLGKLGIFYVVLLPPYIYKWVTFVWCLLMMHMRYNFDIKYIAKESGMTFVEKGPDPVFISKAYDLVFIDTIMYLTSSFGYEKHNVKHKSMNTYFWLNVHYYWTSAVIWIWLGILCTCEGITSGS